MLKDRMQRSLTELLANYDTEIQDVISRVLSLEQEHISQKSPRVKAQIDEIISQMTSKALGDTAGSKVQEQ